MKRRSQKGLTLVEVVVASALLVAAVVPILRAMTIAHGAQRRITEHSRSLAWAEQTLAAVRARAAANYGADLSQLSGALADGYYVDVTDDRHATLRTVSVRVGFDRNEDARLSSNEHNVTLTTLVARLD